MPSRVLPAVLRRLAAVVAVSLVVLLGSVGAVSAHAVLQSSNPADGATLDQAPSSVVLTFDEEVDVSSSAIQLLDADGRRLETGTPQGDEPGAEGSTVITASLPSLAEGRYLVRWQSITSDDFHPVSGTLTFGVGVTVAPGGSDPARPVAEPLEGALRTVAVLGYLLAVGALVVLLALAPVLARRPEAARTASRVSVLGAVVSVAGLVALDGWLVVRSGSAPPTSFLAFWAVAVASVVALAVATTVVHGSVAGSVRGAVAAVVGGGAAVTGAWALGHLGHGAATSGATLTTLHVVATACWAGGLAVLVVVCVPASRRGDRVWANDAVKAFARVAVVAVVVSVATGALMARALVPAWEGLTGTAYGQALALKLLLIGVALVIGAVTMRRARSAGADRRAGTRLLAETTAVVAAVALAAALSGGQPPDDRVWAPSATEPASTGIHSAETDDLLVTLGVSPNQAGDNFVSLHVLDTRRPAPGPVTAVLVDLGDGVERAALRQRAASTSTTTTDQGADEWIVAASLSGDEPVVVTVVVRRSGWDDARIAFPWRVAAAPGTELGGAGIAVLWVLLALAALLGGLLLGGYALHRRRRDAPGAEHDDEAEREPVAVEAAPADR